MWTKHEILYSKLCSKILSRHFALGRYWRTNYISEENYLGHKAYHTCNEKTADANSSQIIRSGEFSSLDDFLRKSNSINLDIERWRIVFHERTNPLSRTGKLFVQWACEVMINKNASFYKKIDLALDTTNSLFKFKNIGNDFAGYMIRFDPVTNDAWREDEKGNPIYCCQFLPNFNSNTFKNEPYIYCSPDQNSLYQKQPGDRYRRWEISQDEIIALIGGFYMLWLALKDDSSIEAVNIINKVKYQSNLIGKYLKYTGYIIVRPCGGFTYRGAADVLPLFELPLSRAIGRINGADPEFYRNRSMDSFENAIKLANKWTEFNRIAASFKQEFPLPSLVVDGINELINSIPDELKQIFFITFGDDIFEQLISRVSENDIINIITNVIYIYQSKDVFDVLNDDNGSFAIAYFIKRIIQSNENLLIDIFLTHGSRPLMNEDGKLTEFFSFSFIPWIGIMSIDDPDPTLCEKFLNKYYYPNIFPLEDIEDGNEIEGTNKLYNNPFTNAIALVLKDDNRVFSKLMKQLELLYKCLSQPYYQDVTNKGRNYNSDLVVVNGENNNVNEKLDSINSGAYLLSLALYWLYLKRKTGVSNIFDLKGNIERFLALPNQFSMNKWPKAIVPGNVLKSVEGFPTAEGFLFPLQTLPINSIQKNITINSFMGNGGSLEYKDLDLFSDPPAIPDISVITKLAPPVTKTIKLEFPDQEWSDSQINESIILGIPRIFKRDFSFDEKPNLYDIDLWTAHFNVIVLSKSASIEEWSIDYDNNIVHLKVVLQAIAINRINHLPVPPFEGGFFKGELQLTWLYDYQ